MNERHPKWVRVEPGTVIPAGQPHRVEWEQWHEMFASEYVIDESFEVMTTREPYFIDSTWSPPLELPTKPTWGIAVTRLPDGRTWGEFSKWSLDLDGQCLNRGGRGTPYLAVDVLDFVELTSEQVARIEATR